jgi:hypothetical protein
LLCAIFAAAPARADDVPVKIGAHAAYTRIVFEFPKLVGYHASKSGDSVTLDFDTTLNAKAPAKLPATVTGFTVAKPDANSLHAVITLAPGEDFKHYRLLRKIVVDVTPSAAPPAKKEPPKVAKAEEKKAPPAAEKPAPEKPATEKTAPEKTAEEKRAPAAAPAQPEAPENTSPAAIALRKTLMPKAAPPAPAVPVAEVASEEASPAPEPEETTISFSTVAPQRLAVFQRFGTLWVVIDDPAAGSFSPEIAGPRAAFLGKPKVFRFGNGTAWRYPMPPDTVASAEKKNLSWKLHLTARPRPGRAPAAPAVDTDEQSGKIKLNVTLPGAGDVLSFEDPSAGDTLFVVPTNQEDARVSVARRLPEVEIVPASMGYVLRPLSDKVRVTRLGDYVSVSTPEGLTATTNVIASVSALEDGDDAADDEKARLFDFPNWRKGGLPQLYKNRRALEAQVAAARSPDDREAALMRLAMLYFANDFGQETLGVLSVIEGEDEEISKNPTFIALKGAANAMAGHYPEALQYLSDPAIQQHPEVNLWIGYAAAATEQWHMANRSFPKSNRLLIKYPDNLAIPFTLYMAESALRLGHTDTAEALLSSVSETSTDFSPQYKAALSYLRGEALRQQGNTDGAIDAWKPVAEGRDRLYHAKASLALANLQLQQKKITLKEAIDKVDGLRFAWRGDGLEVQILQNLGDLKAQDGRYLDGLQDMKEAVMLSDNLQNDSDPIREDMRRVVSDLFVGGQADKVAPLQAVSIYEGFSSMLPQGTADAAAASMRYSDHLIRMDLLPKAEKIFEDNLKAGLVPDALLAATGAKLAAIYLLDAKPAPAIAALDETARGPESAKEKNERELLRARALSLQGKTDEAIHTLSALDSKDARDLKVDVLWRAQKWSEAAAAIEPLLPPASAKLSDDDAKLVVSMAVASRLAGDAKKLEDVKTRYAAGMAGTAQADAFGVVTRAGGASGLADRDTLLKLSGEVDMFKGFLDAYKAGGAKPAPAPGQPPAPPEGTKGG